MFKKINQMVAIKYRAEKDKACAKQQLVYKLSTCQPTIIESIERSPEVWMPIALKSYNTHKGRVDHVGKLLHGFPTLDHANGTTCTQLVWYNLIQLIFWLILQMTLNSYKLYQTHIQRNNIMFKVTILYYAFVFHA